MESKQAVGEPNLVPKTRFTVSEETIDDAIVDVVYQRIGETTVTVCVLVLKNGFNVVGYSACVDPRKFDYDVGRQLARDDAYKKCWEFLGFELSSKLNGSDFLFKKEKVDA